MVSPAARIALLLVLAGLLVGDMRLAGRGGDITVRVAPAWSYSSSGPRVPSGRSSKCPPAWLALAAITAILALTLAVLAAQIRRSAARRMRSPVGVE